MIERRGETMNVDWWQFTLFIGLWCNVIVFVWAVEDRKRICQVVFAFCAVVICLALAVKP